MATTKQQRDVSKALKIARTIKETATNDGVAGLADDLIQILIDMDARTGRRDPTKRKTAKKKK